MIEMSGMTINAFSNHIGLPRSETLYQIKRGNNGISRNLADKITASFPQISKPWLLTGYGPMYAGGENSVRQIPFYNCSLKQLAAGIGQTKPDSYMFLPQIAYADLALYYCGDDMAPSVPDGTVLILKKVPVEALIFGNEYVIIGGNLVTLRKVRVSDRDGCLRLVPANTDGYDEMTIAAADIREAYEVVGKLIVKN